MRYLLLVLGFVRLVIAQDALVPDMVRDVDDEIRWLAVDALTVDDEGRVVLKHGEASLDMAIMFRLLGRPKTLTVENYGR